MVRWHLQNEYNTYIGLFDIKTEQNSSNNSLYNWKSTKGTLQLDALNLQQYIPHFVTYLNLKEKNTRTRGDGVALCII